LLLLLLLFLVPADLVSICSGRCDLLREWRCIMLCYKDLIRKALVRYCCLICMEEELELRSMNVVVVVVVVLGGGGSSRVAGRASYL
jgi:hypothetical protein